MRQQWFQHVAKTRVKMSKGAKARATHKAAMVEASRSWPAVKAKLVKKHCRDSRRAERQARQERTKAEAPTKRARKPASEPGKTPAT